MALSDYPSDETLSRIKSWQWDDPRGLLEFLTAEWREYGRAWRGEDKEWIFATGGWSGNEELIAAFRENWLLWFRLWVSEHRGGKWTFILPEDDQ